ncbi:hypothetical protein E1B28_013477 [Marasmius oreades]|uniref:TauD/TfdA-like domain-containing protein n=1 Tax=Marasmius oreades TaxID=181124 RepID=A0A9P7RQQ4_9AGAR|nr:uncharacterized protein E1B28_013477 [Marasmius oreades]KAG7087516.1 hypothetical protein E1B28_013477 [Marasmius oreades]
MINQSSAKTDGCSILKAVSCISCFRTANYLHTLPQLHNSVCSFSLLMVVCVPPQDFTRPPAGIKLDANGKPLGVAPAAVVQRSHRPWWFTSDQPDRVARLVDIVSHYLFLDGKDNQFEACGRQYLYDLLSRPVHDKKQIEFVFPGFPFKSPSTQKVLGRLPDMGEELLLHRLEALACAIHDEYKPGAVVRIVSDGIVYGELLGQTDTSVYHYNAEFRRICAENRLKHLTFVRLADLLPRECPGVASSDSNEMTLEEYIHAAPIIHSQFLAHDISHCNVEENIKSDSGVLRTYRGYLKFLELDLDGTSLMLDRHDGNPLSGKQRDKIRRQIAKQMIIRGTKFSDLVRTKFPSAVRLSCHEHPNKGPKFALNLFPGSRMSATPWHNVIYEAADGSLRIGHLRSFEKDDYEVVSKHGRPYYIREKSTAYSFEPQLDAQISFTRNFPFGLTISCAPSAGVSFDDLPMNKLRKLTAMHSCILLRGFSQVDRDGMIKKSEELGPILRWPAYGAIFELKENPDWDVNSSLTCEAMPMHYDGVFKTKTDEHGKVVNDPPQIQVFQCIQAPGNEGGGQTILTNTADILRYGVSASLNQSLSLKTWTVFTPQNTVFGGDHLKLPLVTKNELTGNDILRWHDPWPQWVTKFKATKVGISESSREEEATIIELLSDLLYDRRFCFVHTWETGDFLIADNIELLHTRTAFLPSPRELWRIHVN